MVRWLEGQLDDMDAKLLIAAFDPENLRYNIDCVDYIHVKQKPVSHSWDDFMSKLTPAE